MGDTVYSAATGLSAELVEVWGVVALWGEVAGVCLCVCVCVLVCVFIYSMLTIVMNSVPVRITWQPV